MDLRQIREFSKINGENRAPNITENGMYPMWDFATGYFVFKALNNNTKLSAGFVSSGDTSSAGNYIWKLDSSKNPAWRKEQYLVSATKSTTSSDAIFTMNDGTIITLPLKDNAWTSSEIGEGIVNSVFGRTGDVVAVIGDYTASQITDAFDLSTNVLGDIPEGNGAYKFTSTYRSFLDTLINNNIDQISNIGSGEIITTAERDLWNSYASSSPDTIKHIVGTMVNDSSTIIWVYDEPNGTITPSINFENITTDNIIEGNTNLYFTEERLQDISNIIDIILPPSTSVAGRCIAPTYLPIGWTVSALSTNSNDLLITHNLDRRIANVTIFTQTGTQEELLFNNSAYSAIIAPDANTLIIRALATIETTIIIHLMFV